MLNLNTQPHIPVCRVRHPRPKLRRHIRIRPQPRSQLTRRLHLRNRRFGGDSNTRPRRG
ncbi:hypothetical protein FHR33_004219 [Nonomuraea dietziae]|uniref:Uncharacterized protein n=1 Tax=Nonomuraea dietziae TaxID=65515 RepID=A0A7W5VB25_9ACTN|nr:hypothetical protein [Nonomuraea dietziae]